MLVAKTTSTLNGSSNFWPGLQGEEVHAALERHDPAVEQVARVRTLLAAEVVDDEHAAVGHQPARARGRSPETGL
jgi:hypothetical protein